MVEMLTMTRGNSTLEGLMFSSSQLAISMGAMMPKTMTELWMNWASSAVMTTYPSMTMVRDPWAMRLTLEAHFFTNWVRLNPAATTNMESIMMPLVLPK